jgi:hypothetical protein
MSSSPRVQKLRDRHQRKGEIIGYYGDIPAGHFHGFVRDPNETITTFDPPGSIGAGTFAYSINDDGAITGRYFAQGAGSHGYVRDPEGNFTTFDPPGSFFTIPISINGGGAVTGNYVGEAVHGFVRRADGKLISFDPPGSVAESEV